METSFKRAFARDLRKIPHQKREKIEEFVFVTVPQAESTEDLSPIIALSGHTGFDRKDLVTTESDLGSVRFRVTGIQTTSYQVERKTVRSAG